MLEAFQAISGGQIDDFNLARECHKLFLYFFFSYFLLNMFPGVVRTAHQRTGFDVTKADTQRLFP